MAQQHARAGVPHDCSDAFTLICAVAVNLTPIADRFLLLEWTNLQAPEGIPEQTFAIAAQTCPRRMVVIAEELHHGPDRGLLARDTRPGHI